MNVGVKKTISRIGIGYGSMAESAARNSGQYDAYAQGRREYDQLMAQAGMY